MNTQASRRETRAIIIYKISECIYGEGTMSSTRSLCGFSNFKAKGK
jgi:hypothetical protein